MISVLFVLALALQANLQEPAAEPAQVEPLPLVIGRGRAAELASPPPRVSIIEPATVKQVAPGGDLARYYPDEASRLELGGKAEVTCFVSIFGRAKDCRVTYELPAGLGFGEATKQVIMEAYRFEPARRDGVAYEEWPIYLTISWSPPQ